MVKQQFLAAHGLHILAHWTDWTLSRSFHKLPAPPRLTGDTGRRVAWRLLPAYLLQFTRQLTSVPSRQAPDSVGGRQPTSAIAEARPHSDCALKAACTRGVRRMSKADRRQRRAPTAAVSHPPRGAAVPRTTAPGARSTSVPSAAIAHRCIVLVPT